MRTTVRSAFTAADDSGSRGKW